MNLTTNPETVLKTKTYQIIPGSLSTVFTIAQYAIFALSINI